tara:strand:+ start:290 stop:463 length:174 start_codon:yes stop_codon:yes gene_type:complete
MKWYEVELEIPILGKNFETVQSTDLETAKMIALIKTESQYNVSRDKIFITKIKEVNL